MVAWGVSARGRGAGQPPSPGQDSTGSPPPAAVNPLQAGCLRFPLDPRWITPDRADALHRRDILLFICGPVTSIVSSVTVPSVVGLATQEITHSVPLLPPVVVHQALEKRPQAAPGLRAQSSKCPIIKVPLCQRLGAGRAPTTAIQSA